MTNNSTHPLNSAIDEAIWAAYRRDDKVAVMDYLFRRSLVGIGRSRSFPQFVIKTRSKTDRAAAGAHRRSVRIKGHWS
jgi:hypothetical protein